jgi:glucosamine--fructose-6-phosphate aminotransferase (isomerizing)
MQASLSAATTWLAKGTDAPLYAALLQSSRALVVGRGFEYPNALELALKLRETTGTFADGYSAADLLHGPIASAGAEVPAILLSTDAATRVSIETARERLRSAGSPILLMGTAALAGTAEDALIIPVGPSGPLCTPVTAIAGLTIVESIATRRGRNPDAPEGLAKITKTL